MRCPREKNSIYTHRAFGCNGNYFALDVVDSCGCEFCKEFAATEPNPCNDFED